MKKIITFLMGFLALHLSFAVTATMKTSGQMDDSSNWDIPPSKADSLRIPFGKTAMFKNVSLFNIQKILLFGDMGPSTGSAAGGGNQLHIDTGASIEIYPKGRLLNLSKNNSNHGVFAGPVCLYGKYCCSGTFTILGPAIVDGSNPCNYSVLPVNILSFDASVEHNIVKLNWVVTIEENIQGYTLKSSRDFQNWTDAGSVNKTNTFGEKEYSINDTLARDFVGEMYYMLYEVTTNGDQNVLGTVFVQKDPEEFVFVKENSIIISIPEAINLTTRVYEISTGKIILNQQSPGNFMQIQTQNLPPGNYCIYVLDDIGVVYNKKVVIQ